MLIWQLELLHTSPLTTQDPPLEHSAGPRAASGPKLIAQLPPLVQVERGPLTRQFPVESHVPKFTVQLAATPGVTMTSPTKGNPKVSNAMDALVLSNPIGAMGRQRLRLKTLFWLMADQYTGNEAKGMRPVGMFGAP